MEGLSRVRNRVQRLLEGMSSLSARRLAVVTSGFPRLSETFALNELLALEARGMLAGIFATKRGDDGGRDQPGVEG